jgi:hypothetical protein
VLLLQTQPFIHPKQFTTMSSFAVPTREDVSPQNQALFDNLKGALGFVPNLYATIAYSAMRWATTSSSRTSKRR